MSLKNAFNYIINLHGRDMLIYESVTRPVGVDTIKVCVSNYFRSPEGPSATVTKGREFVLMADPAKTILTRPPRRGDRLYDSEYGVMIIEEVREMPDIGGKTMGYRVRTN